MCGSIYINKNELLIHIRLQSMMTVLVNTHILTTYEESFSVFSNFEEYKNV